MSGRSKHSDEDVAAAVGASLTYAEALSRLGLAAAGGNYATIQRVVRKLGLDTSHMRGQGWAKGRTVTPRVPAIPLAEILVQDSSYQSHKLKRRLLNSGLLPRICARCGNSKWLGATIPLELYHVNGVKTDNRLENLQLLCPNCHALTKSYRGRNIGRPAEVVEGYTRSS